MLKNGRDKNVKTFSTFTNSFFNFQFSLRKKIQVQLSQVKDAILIFCAIL